MLLSVQLKTPTSPLWIQEVLKNFDEFLIDHAANERKASAMGVNFVVQYPDRTEIIDPLLRFAREELLHYHQVTKLMLARGLQGAPDQKCAYVSTLLAEVRTGRNERFLDRLLLCAVLEARGCERFSIVAKHHPEAEIRDFYEKLFSAEERHREIFIELAQIYFSPETIASRLEELLAKESQVIENLPLRPAVH